MSLQKSVTDLAERCAKFPQLKNFEPLLVLLIGLGEKFDADELPGVAVQQLRMGLKEVRDALAEAEAVAEEGSVVREMLEAARAG